jgi:hypothetical protein
MLNDEIPKGFACPLNEVCTQVFARRSHAGMAGIKLGKLRQRCLERTPQSAKRCRPFTGKLVLDARTTVRARRPAGEGVLSLGLNGNAPNLKLSH